MVCYSCLWKYHSMRLNKSQGVFMKHKKFMILAFCLFLFVSNVFSQQINFDSYKRDDVNAFDRLIMNPYS